MKKIIFNTVNLIKDNSNTVLTVFGCVGVATTAVLTSKATLKAYEIIKDDDTPVESLGENLEDFEIPVHNLKLVWKEYIPVAVTGVLTISCIIAANRISIKKQAVIAGLYSLSESNFKEYKKKVVEMVGEKKEKKIETDTREEKMNKAPVLYGNDSCIYYSGDGNDLCFDQLSGRYFLSSMDALKKAQNDINHRLCTDWRIDLNDVYGYFGLDTIPLGGYVGWNNDYLIDLEFDSLIQKHSGRPVLSVTFTNSPKPIGKL